MFLSDLDCFQIAVAHDGAAAGKRLDVGVVFEQLREFRVDRLLGHLARTPANEAFQSRTDFRWTA